MLKKMSKLTLSPTFQRELIALKPATSFDYSTNALVA